MVYCVLIAAGITALTHSSSATIGIVMGLGTAGVLGWKTAVAFSLGADLGTTITSWMASLNLSKNAKRAAYAHISFNIIGVAVMLPLFFPSMTLLTWVMGWFGGDPGVPVVRDGRETFPLVPVAVGLYSTAFNVFNTALLFPFVGVFDRVLSRIGHTSSEDVEDFSVARFLDPGKGGELAAGVPLVQQEMARYIEAANLFLAIAGKEKSAPHSAKEHQVAIDILNRDIRRYTAAMFKPDMPRGQADLLASLIEEEDFSASLGATLFQVARRVERPQFSPVGRELVAATLDQIAQVHADHRPRRERRGRGRQHRGRAASSSCCRRGNAACGWAPSCHGKSAGPFWHCWAARSAPSFSSTASMPSAGRCRGRWLPPPRFPRPTSLAVVSPPCPARRPGEVARTSPPEREDET